ncbi:glycosyltransferase, partial [bacterium]|nr:glycosyltransferase [bacterium]
MRIAQLVPALHHGDAIGNNSLALRDYFRNSGFESAIFYIDADRETISEGMHYFEYSAWMKNTKRCITILHYALPSPLNQLFRDAGGSKILVYHNITPPEFLVGYPQLQHISRAGRYELAQLKSVPDVSLADSEYNRMELVEMGFSNTFEMPIFLDYSVYSQTPCQITLRMFPGRDVMTFLFVGRITPNKCQHDIIRLYGFYKRYVNPRCRLLLVGKYEGFEKYLWECRKMVNRLRLGDVFFTGRATHAELLAYYKMADIFVSMSEHEGFGVPLLESMCLDLPILAYATAAVPYTLGSAGVKFSKKKQWLEIAELAHLMVTDKNLRNQ